MSVILYSLAALIVTALAGAGLLYFVSKRFAVEADPRVDEISSLLPGANCGGCGFKGCRDFAENCVAADSLNGIYCPVGGASLMEKIARITGMVPAGDLRIPVAAIMCNGSCVARDVLASYDGVSSCAILASVAVGDRPCCYGCLGRGDCAVVCDFGAITVDPDTGIASVDPERCTACGKCIKVCPRHIIRLVPRGNDDRRVWVACSNHDRGAIARKMCMAACIACGKCVRSCPDLAVEIIDNIAVINPESCTACGKCVQGCPTGAILSTFKCISDEA